MVAPEIETALEGFLRGRACLFGFGNRMWRDDGAGSRLAASLEDCPGVDAVDGGMAPENHLENVVAKKPERVLMIDTADFGAAPGETRFLNPEHTIPAGLSTHAGSPQMLAAYLRARTGARVSLLVIQAGDTRAGDKLSPGVVQALNGLRACIKRAGDS